MENSFSEKKNLLRDNSMLSYLVQTCLRWWIVSNDPVKGQPHEISFYAELARIDPVPKKKTKNTSTMRKSNSTFLHENIIVVPQRNNIGIAFCTAK